VWAFDVDGCLIDLLGGTTLRPLALEVLAAIAARGDVAVLWSAGGAGHAERKAVALGLSSYVSGYYEKGELDGAGRWSTTHLPARHAPDVCVDDAPEHLPLHVRTIAVRPYTAPAPHDLGLAGLLDELREGSRGARY
jgi:hypothetical protein